MGFNRHTIWQNGKTVIDISGTGQLNSINDVMIASEVRSWLALLQEATWRWRGSRPRALSTQPRTSGKTIHDRGQNQSLQ